MPPVTLATTKECPRNHLERWLHHEEPLFFKCKNVVAFINILVALTIVVQQKTTKALWL